MLWTVPRRENKARPEKQENKKERKIKQLRKEIKTLRKQFKSASMEEKEGIKELTASLREQLIRARRAEGLRQRRKWLEAAQAQFIKAPYRFTKSLLGQVRSGTLASSKEEVEEFVEETFSDPLRGDALPEGQGFGTINQPTSSLNTEYPSWKEVQEVIKNARSSSAPGPSGILYKVYKKCPKLLQRLWRLMRKSGPKEQFQQAGEGQRDPYWSADQPVPNHFLTQCRGENLLFRAGQKNELLHDPQRIYRHLYPEGWH